MIPFINRSAFFKSTLSCTGNGMLFLLVFSVNDALSQDTLIQLEQRVVTLKEVVVRNNVNAAGLMHKMERDTSFYKAFKNLKVLEFTALNDVQMFGKKGKLNASLHSKTRQQIKNGCRNSTILEQEVKGDMLKNNQWNYYTMEMYAGLMFATATVCGENNIVAGTERTISGKSGIEKHKEQLKYLFFNPGKKIPGIPFIGNKIAVFEPAVAVLYDFIIDMEMYQGKYTYSFLIKVKEALPAGKRNSIVLNEMKTWFDMETLSIVARSYDLSYDAGVYDFDVQMEVQLTHYKDYLVPQLIRYHGNWHALFKPRERGVFTATLFDYK